jgi:hypothetical protein
MMTIIDRVRNRNDLDVRWPARALLEALAFETRVGGRVADYMKTRGIEALSLRELMDWFLPPLSEPLLDFDDFWRHIPMLDQPQFGPYLHDSALVTLTDADLGSAFRAEWAARLDRLKLYELGTGRWRKHRRPGRQREGASGDQSGRRHSEIP